MILFLQCSMYNFLGEPRSTSHSHYPKCTVGSKAEWRFWFPGGKKFKSVHFESL